MCEFGKTSLVYLGYIVGGGKLRIDPSKVEAIVNWPTPKIEEKRYQRLRNKPLRGGNL